MKLPETVKTWTEYHYVHPEGYNFYRPKNHEGLVKKEITMKIVSDGTTFVGFCENTNGGPIMSADTLEECESKLKQGFMLSIYVGGLVEADKISIETMLREFVVEHPQYLVEYKNGNKGLLGLFVGEIMKRRKGKGDPRTINTIVLNFLDTV